MKFNKWTLGLATVGAVSLVSAARADEKMNSLQTALSNTTISGYVSASMNWEITPNNNSYPAQASPAANIPLQGGKQNGFNLDVVSLTIAKPEDESPWASGYNVNLIFGPDAVGWNPSANSAGTSDFSIKQAYVTLRTPVGNGIDWKIGTFDTVIGYEAFDAGSNPNYTRSWGWAIEPTEHTGILATYKISDMLTVSAGIANTLSTGINTRAYDLKAGAGGGSFPGIIGYLGGGFGFPVYATQAEANAANGGTGIVNKDWNKTLMGSATFTAPTNWGWAAGSSIYAGVVWGFNGTATTLNGVGSAGGGGNNGFYANGNQANYYAGATLNTPWKQLTTGVAFDYVHNLGGGVQNLGSASHVDVWTLGLYGTFKATDKLSFNGRAEWLEATLHGYNGAATRYGNTSGYELTATVEYDLWANVITRVEGRWDGVNDNPDYPSFSNSSFGLYANVIYKF